MYGTRGQSTARLEEEERASGMDFEAPAAGIMHSFLEDGFHGDRIFFQVPARQSNGIDYLCDNFTLRHNNDLDLDSQDFPMNTRGTPQRGAATPRVTQRGAAQRGAATPLLHRGPAPQRLLGQRSLGTSIYPTQFGPRLTLPPSQVGANARADNAMEDPPAPADSRVHTDKMLNKFGLPSLKRREALLVQKAEEYIHRTSDSTNELCGDMQDPFSKRGHAKEFADWCRADKNTVFHGVKTNPEKQIYLIPRSPEVIAYEYLKHHFLVRKQFNRTSRDYTVDKPHSLSAVKNVVKALDRLYTHQSNVWPEGAEDFAKIVGRRPSGSLAISTLIYNYGRKAAARNRANHAPRGLGSLCMEGYTDDQKQQMCEFGLTNHSLEHHNFGYLSAANVRAIHTHHVLASNYFLRFDDRHQIEWSQLCCQESDDRTKETGHKLACLVLEKRKNNQSRDKYPVFSHRHLSDPYKCSFFALGLELFGQTHLDGLPFMPTDFKPEPHMGSDGLHDGTYRHPWYDRCIFVGNTKARKGECSTPDPYNHCIYQTVLSHFKKMYQQIDPPLVSYHKLHLERGQTARDAEKAGVGANAIATHGQWKIRDALRECYLTGIPMELIRHLAGFDPMLVNGKPLPKIRRDLLEPPKELRDMVFPFLKPVKEEYEADLARQEADPKYVGEYPKKECGALSGFLELTTLLSKTFLQDCAVLYEDMSNHPIFSTPVLQSRLFQIFRLGLIEKMESYEAFASEDKVAVESPPDPAAQKCLSLVKKLFKLLTEVSHFDSLEDGELQAILLEFDTPLLGTKWATTSTRPVYNPRVLTTNIKDADSPATASAVISAVDASPRRGMSPSDVRSTMPMQQHFPLEFLDMKQHKSQWPKECPPPLWARNKWFVPLPETPRELVDEYLVGLPHPPGLRDLEEIYGPDAGPHMIRGKSWRSHPNPKQANKKRKEWCNRLGLYKFIDENPLDAVQRLEVYIQENYATELQQLERTCEKPGPTILRKAMKKMKSESEGAEGRRLVAKQRAIKRKTNKENETEPCGAERAYAEASRLHAKERAEAIGRLHAKERAEAMVGQAAASPTAIPTGEDAPVGGPVVSPASPTADPPASPATDAPAG